MSKKIYKLSDIEKILTYTPPIFLLLLTAISIFITFLVIERQQNNKIALTDQELKFFYQKQLDDYIEDTHQKIKIRLSKAQQELQKSVHLLKGVYATTRYKGLTSHLKEIEEKDNILFVIFDKDLKIYHGEKIAKNIQRLIFNKKKDKKYLDLTLLYISSQGIDSSFSWRDDHDKTIQLSYFDITEDGELYIGAFSLVDSIRNLTLDEYIRSINNTPSDTTRGYYFWIYDYAKRNSFNIDNKENWEIATSFKAHDHYRNLIKYQLHIGITPNPKAIEKNIELIKNEYRVKTRFSFFIIFLLSLLLLTFTTLFSSFIKKRFSIYNNQLEALVQEEVEKNEEKQKLLIQQNRLAAMGEMIGSIAHQWRQPLNNISLIVHFIKDNIKEQTFDSFFTRAKEQIEYMSQTIDDFRDFHKPSKNSEPFDVKEAIKSAISILHVGQNITINLHGIHLYIDSYKNEFQQAILNILSNAKDAIGQEDGVIEVEVSEEKITVHNSGREVSKEVLEKMFEPYFTTKSDKKGTGIGLYMTKAIIEDSMGGEIYVTSDKDGITFTILL
ncbi:MAG TPA: HAMP domain-containing histidine kinase [Sulfurospirillum arcachonense]|nr:HAMP domain-containing histidine kinase [Sulfurospirillum arcachonense]HIP44022.1 HAMP domain-containing histidine kinase [Sulfurospirillum arcachonense]